MPSLLASKTLSPPESEVISETTSDRNSGYDVILHNDDVTPMDFVIYVLMHIFPHPLPAATHLMLVAHREGRVVVATLPLEVAELRKEQVHTASRRQGYPLNCTVEPA